MKQLQKFKKKVWSIKDIVDSLQGRIDNDFDIICIIDGGTGKGKSTLAYKVLKRLKRFKLKRDAFYSRDDVLREMESRKKGIIWADELINVAHNRTFYEPDQVELVKKFNMYRDSNNCFVGCIPEFVRLDPQLITLSHIRITIIKRGVGVVQLPREAMYSRDPWDIKNNAKIEAKWTSGRSKKPKYHQLTTFAGYVYFSKLTTKEEERYKQNKSDKRAVAFQQHQEVKEESDPNKQFYQRVLKLVKSGTLTPTTFMHVCLANGRKVKTVQHRINELLKEEGVPQRYCDFVKSNNSIIRKDSMGFASKKEEG